MVVRNFNYHQILFALDTLKLNDEKFGYLEKISRELNRIIECFESPKALPLKMYASNNININDSCNELKEFIKKQFEMISTNPYDKRYPGEGELRGLVRNELVNYKKLQMIINDEIKKLKDEMKKESQNSSPKDDGFILPQKTTPSYIAKLLKNNPNKKIIWNNSIGELIDLMKILIVLELYPELDKNKIVTFINEHFVNSHRKRYSSKQVEKVYKMLQNTFWLNSRNSTPKFFQ